MHQIMPGNQIEKLSKLPYFLVGQRPAANTVRDYVYSHIAMGKKKPLVISFSGPSGHGKTELALAPGELLSTMTEPIDMAGMSSVHQLFGAPASYLGREDGSKLNNHLAAYSGRRSVVFLDEFDKSNQGVWDPLLLVMQSGKSFPLNLLRGKY
jgi:ATP-dependent Clp protease ATP-binding subunit ClpA